MVTTLTLTFLVVVAVAAARHFRRLRRDIAAELTQAREAHAALEERLTRTERLVEETQRLGHLGTWEWDAENDRLKWSA
jgi:hypothetical protein